MGFVISLILIAFGAILTWGSTLPPFEFTAQVRIAPQAIRIRLMTIPIAEGSSPSR